MTIALLIDHTIKHNHIDVEVVNLTMYLIRGTNLVNKQTLYMYILSKHELFLL